MRSRPSADGPQAAPGSATLRECGGEIVPVRSAARCGFARPSESPDLPGGRFRTLHRPTRSHPPPAHGTGPCPDTDAPGPERNGTEPAGRAVNGAVGCDGGSRLPTGGPFGAGFRRARGAEGQGRLRLLCRLTWGCPLLDGTWRVFGRTRGEVRRVAVCPLLLSSIPVGGVAGAWSFGVRRCVVDGEGVANRRGLSVPGSAVWGRRGRGGIVSCAVRGGSVRSRDAARWVGPGDNVMGAGRMRSARPIRLGPARPDFARLIRAGRVRGAAVRGRGPGGRGPAVRDRGGNAHVPVGLAGGRPSTACPDGGRTTASPCRPTRVSRAIDAARRTRPPSGHSSSGSSSPPSVNSSTTSAAT